jgi:hypothetical protein
MRVNIFASRSQLGHGYA